MPPATPFHELSETPAPGSLDNLDIDHRLGYAAKNWNVPQKEKREELTMADKAKGSSGPQWQRLSKVKAMSAGPARLGVGCGSTPRISRRAFVKGSAGAAL